MSFGGSVAAMIATLKNNRIMLGERYTYFDAKKRYLRVTKGMKISYKKATPEELALVRKKLQKQKKRERVRVGIVLSFIVPIIAFGIYQTKSIFEDNLKEKKEIIQKKDAKKYQFYISDGDLMIEQRKWNNAIFQYTRALEIFPNELDAQYRLALAYTYKCQNTNEDCFKGDSLVNRLMHHFPEDEKVQELKKVIKTQLHD